MTYPEVIQYLYDLRLFGLKLGLENTFKLAALAGNPQDKLRFIHVAGTNGKGSTCAMLESIYRAAGLRVGLFTSPHLVSFRERIQVNRRLISEVDVVRLVSEMKGLIETGWDESRSVVDVATSFSLGHSDVGALRKLKLAATGPAAVAGAEASHPTFFEVVTVMALRHFAEQRCELVIWETGMGGRLDATNIVTPLASVITNVQFDHQKWLGQTRSAIATEKAGIIKGGVPVITATDGPEALQVLEQTAHSLGASLTVVTPRDTSRIVRDASLPLPGEHQRLNATLAATTVEVLRDKILVSDEAIRVGLETVQWPGRLQVIKTQSGQTILLDGAHNVASAEALRAALQGDSLPLARRRGAEATLILGVLEDKDWTAMSEVLAPLARKIFLVPVHSERTAPPQALLDACRVANPMAQVATCPSLADALKQAANDPFVTITGSLYLVGEAMELLGLLPEAGLERGLNEWSVKQAPIARHQTPNKSQ